MFDTDTFLSSSVEGEMDTEFPVVPAGEYPAHIEKLDTRSGVSDKGPWAVMDIYWAINDGKVLEEMERDDPPLVRQSIFLDLTEDGSGLALGKGKNVQLGRLREALGQNAPGPWSPGQLIGSSAQVKVEHDLYEGKTYANVTRVVSA